MDELGVLKLTSGSDWALIAMNGDLRHHCFHPVVLFTKSLCTAVSPCVFILSNAGNLDDVSRSTVVIITWSSFEFRSADSEPTYSFIWLSSLITSDLLTWSPLTTSSDRLFSKHFSPQVNRPEAMIRSWSLLVNCVWNCATHPVPSRSRSTRLDDQRLEAQLEASRTRIMLCSQ